MGKSGKADDERLQRYFDGELSPEERAQVEASLDEDGRLKLAALGEVRGLVANSLSAESADVDLWPALAGLIGNGAAAGSGVAATGIAGSGGGKAAHKARRRWGLMAHPGSWSAGFVAAAAAALLLILQPWHPAHASNGCDIESLETDGAMASVIHMSDAPHRGENGTTVIWTMEED